MSLADRLRNRATADAEQHGTEDSRATVPREWLIDHLEHIRSNGLFNEAFLDYHLGTSRRTQDGSLAVLAPGRDDPVLGRRLWVPDIKNAIEALEIYKTDEVMIGVERFPLDRGFQTQFGISPPEDEDRFGIAIPSGSPPEEVGDRQIESLQNAQEEAVPILGDEVTELRDNLWKVLTKMDWRGNAPPLDLHLRDGRVTFGVRDTELPRGRKGASATHSFSGPKAPELGVDTLGVEPEIFINILRGLPRNCDHPVHFGLTTESRPRLTMGYQGYIWAMKADTETDQ